MTPKMDIRKTIYNQELAVKEPPQRESFSSNRVNLPHLRSSVQIVASKYGADNNINNIRRHLQLSESTKHEYSNWLTKFKQLGRKGVANQQTAQKEFNRRVFVFKFSDSET